MGFEQVRLRIEKGAYVEHDGAFVEVAQELATSVGVYLTEGHKARKVITDFSKKECAPLVWAVLRSSAQHVNPKKHKTMFLGTYEQALKEYSQEVRSWLVANHDHLPVELGDGTIVGAVAYDAELSEVEGENARWIIDKQKSENPADWCRVAANITEEPGGLYKLWTEEERIQLELLDECSVGKILGSGEAEWSIFAEFCSFVKKSLIHSWGGSDWFQGRYTNDPEGDVGKDLREMFENWRLRG